jgi:hypothetical protein
MIVLIVGCLVLALFVAVIAALLGPHLERIDDKTRRGEPLEPWETELVRRLTHPPRDTWGWWI